MTQLTHSSKKILLNINPFASIPSMNTNPLIVRFSEHPTGRYSPHSKRMAYYHHSTTCEATWISPGIAWIRKYGKPSVPRKPGRGPGIEAGVKFILLCLSQFRTGFYRRRVVVVVLLNLSSTMTTTARLLWWWFIEFQSIFSLHTIWIPWEVSLCAIMYDFSMGSRWRLELKAGHLHGGERYDAAYFTRRLSAGLVKKYWNLEKELHRVSSA